MDIEELHAAGSVSTHDISRQSRNVGVRSTRTNKNQTMYEEKGQIEKTAARGAWN